MAQVEIQENEITKDDIQAGDVVELNYYCSINKRSGPVDICVPGDIGIIWSREEYSLDRLFVVELPRSGETIVMENLEEGISKIFDHTSFEHHLYGF